MHRRTIQYLIAERAGRVPENDFIRRLLHDEEFAVDPPFQIDENLADLLPRQLGHSNAAL
jgi:hypothetical protein